MVSMEKYYQQMLLSAASYIDLDPDLSAAEYRQALLTPPSEVFGTISETELSAFIARYTIIDSTTDQNGAALGSGLSATVFRDNTTGHYTLAIRGSEATLSDWLGANLGDIGTYGFAVHQGLDLYNYLLRATARAGDIVPVYTYVGDSRPSKPVEVGSIQVTKDGALAGIPDLHLDVVGHSLGGHLGLLISRLMPPLVGDVYGFDAPGFESPAEATFYNLAVAGIPVSSGFDAATVHLLDGQYDAVSDIGVRPVEGETLFTEEPGVYDAHALANQVPILSLGRLFEELDPDFTLDDFNTVLDAATADDTGAAQATLDAFAAIFGVPAGDGVTGDNAYYKQIEAVSRSSSFPNALVNIVYLNGLEPNAVAIAARGSAGYLYALENLNAFAVVGDDTLYPNLDSAPFSDQYLGDRALLLSDVIRTNTADSIFPDGMDYGPYPRDAVHFVDVDTGYDVRHLPQSPGGLVAFGGQAVGDTFLGTSEADFVYGRGGADVISTGGGDDQLEGGSGNDALHAGDGDDSMIGGAGEDYLEGGYGNDTLYGGHADGGDDGARDLLDGGAGNDTYYANFGDVIDDVQGTSTVYYNGDLIAGSYVEGGSTQVYRQKNGHRLLWVEPDGTARILGSYLEIRNFDSHSFGIDIVDNSTAATYALEICGDLAPQDFDPNAAGVQTQVDALGNVITTASPDLGRPDVLYDSAGDDAVYGGAGDDLLDARLGGNDYLDGGAGRDVVMARTGNDTLVGGEGADLLRGDAGDDALYADGESSLSGALTAGDATPSGEKGDFIDGGTGADFLVGGMGNDVVNGGAGSDVIVGGAGDDEIDGDLEADYVTLDWAVTRSISEEDGARTYTTSFDNATFSAPTEGGADVLYGGAGDDWANAGLGDDFVDGGSGNDVIFGQEGNDVAFGGDGDDVLSGDSSETPVAEQGDDYVDGGTGDDLITGMGGNDLLLGGAGNDQLDGDDGHDSINGGVGDDVLVGGSGADSLKGADGNDMLLGGSGNDVLDGGGGDDYLDGGEGDDLYRIGAGGGINAIKAESGVDRVAFSDIRSDQVQVVRSGGDLRITGNSGDVQVVLLDWYTTSNSHIAEVAFADGTVWKATELTPLSATQEGGDGDDTLSGYADLANTLSGGTGNDVLLGGAKADQLAGGDGADTLSGRGGEDSLNGGLGADTYIVGGIGSNALLTDDVSDGAANTVRFVEGLTAASTTVARSESDLRLTFATGGTATLTGYYSAPQTWKFQTASGAVIPADALFSDRTNMADGAFMETERARFVETQFAEFAGASPAPLQGDIQIWPLDPLVENRQILDDVASTSPELAALIAPKLLVGGISFVFLDDILNRYPKNAEVINVEGSLNDDTLALGPDGSQKTYSMPAYLQLGALISDEGSSYRATIKGCSYVRPFNIPAGELTSSGDMYNGYLRMDVKVREDTHYIQSVSAGGGNDMVGEADFVSATGSHVAPLVIDGGAGFDRLYGGWGGDFISGGADADYLYGYSGADTLSGGEGNDMLYGGTGADRYLIGFDESTRDNIIDDGPFTRNLAGYLLEGAQPMSWQEAEEFIRTADEGEIRARVGYGLPPSEEDVAVFNASSADVEFSWGAVDNGRVTVVVSSLRNPAAEAVLYMRGQGDVAGFGVEKLEFSDTILSMQEVVDALPSLPEGLLLGSASDNEIIGTDETDILVGYAGWDDLYGEDGNDVYLFNAGDESDWILDLSEQTGGSGIDTLSLGGGLQPEGVSASVQRQEWATGWSTTLYLETGGGDSIEITWESEDSGDGYLDARVEKIQFLDSTGARVFDLAGLVASRMDELIAADAQQSPVPLFTADALANFDVTASVGVSGGDAAWAYALTGDPTASVTIPSQPTPVYGTAGGDSLVGTAENDILDGGAGNDRIDGDAGNDQIIGGSGYDTLVGGEGDDTFLVTGTDAAYDLVSGGAGLDTIAGRDGDDTFLVTGTDAAYDLVSGGSGLDSILGSDGDDTIRLHSFQGDNTVEVIDGGAGTDVVAGTAGGDTLDLSATELRGIEQIDGGAGNDRITGTTAADVIVGGAGYDTLAGGEGDDTFLVTGTDAAYDLVSGGAGLDTIVGSDGDDTIRLHSFQGDNTVEVIDGGAGTDVVAGTAGGDVLDLSGTELRGIEQIDGGAGNDRITGTAAADTIIGGAATTPSPGARATIPSSWPARMRPTIWSPAAPAWIPLSGVTATIRFACTASRATTPLR